MRKENRRGTRKRPPDCVFGARLPRIFRYGRRRLARQAERRLAGGQARTVPRSDKMSVFPVPHKKNARMGLHHHGLNRLTIGGASQRPAALPVTHGPMGACWRLKALR